MLILRIRQAETALADGRLDEAYEVARSDDFRVHRKGQEVIGELARKLIERGHAHLQNQRISEALADCEKAGKLGGNLLQAAELRVQITEALTGEQARNRQQRETLDAAKRHVAARDLTIADGLLADLSPDASKVVQVKRQIDQLRGSAEAALKRAEAAIERGDWEVAAEALRTGPREHATDPRLSELAAQVRVGLSAAIRENLQHGRLERADLLVHALAGLAAESGDTREFKAVIAHCRQAMACIERGQFRSADEGLRRLRAALPEANWIAAAQEAVRQAAEKLEEVRGGPLGWWTTQSLASSEPGQTPPPGAPVKPRQHTAEELPARFLLSVDGVGSYLVVCKDRVTIGPISASRPPDVALLAEAGTPTAIIERDEDDYFLCQQATGAAASRKLLADGDRIPLSARCSLRFAQPHAASPSAVLHLGSGRLPHGDARRIILMDKAFVIGPGTGSHVRADMMSQPLVLHMRDGRLFCRSEAEVTIDGRPADTSSHIGLGAHVCAGGLSFHVAKV